MIKEFAIKVKRNLCYKDILLVTMLLVYSSILLAIFYKFQPDDTFIYLVYIKNFLQGKGLTFNGMYVEGYSSITWTYFLAILSFFTNNFLLLAKLVSLIFTFLTACLIYIISKKLYTNKMLAFLSSFLYLSIPSIIIWTAGALETQLYTFLLVLLIYLLTSNTEKSSHKYIGFTFGLLAATRPEGAAFIGLMIIYQTYNIFINKNYEKFLKVYIYYAISLCLIFIWRYSFYGELLPTTVYAKTGSILNQIPHGINYLHSFINYYKIQLITFLILVIVILYKRIIKNQGDIFKNNSVFINLILILGYISFIMFAGGDWMIGYRFFVPIIPSVILVIILGLAYIKSTLSRKGIVLILVVLITISNIQTYYFFDKVKNDYTATYGDIVLGKYLEKNTDFNDVIAVVDAGAIPYYCESAVIDMVGLNNKHISKLTGTFMNKYDNKYVLSNKPKYIQMHTLYSKNGELRPVNFIGVVKLFFSKEFQENYELDVASPIPQLYKRTDKLNNNIMEDYYNAKIDFYRKGKNVTIKLMNNGTGTWFAENNNNGQGCVYLTYKIIDKSGEIKYTSPLIPIEKDLKPKDRTSVDIELPNLVNGAYKIEAELVQKWVGNFKDKKPQMHSYIFKIGENDELRPIKDIYLGKQQSLFYLLEGFSGIEKHEGHSWRWSEGPESTLKIPLKEETSYEVTIKALPFNIPGKHQSMNIFLNGEFIDTISFNTIKYNEYVFILPRDKVGQINLITFKYKYINSPYNIYGTDDKRLLGVNFNNITFKERQDNEAYTQ